MTGGITYDDATTAGAVLLVKEEAVFADEKVGTQADKDVLTFHFSQWQIDAVKAIIETKNLPQNWDSYGSPPPSSNAILAALKLVSIIRFDDLPSPRVVPVSGGGVQLVWRKARRELDIEMLPDGTMEFLSCEGGSPVKDGPLAVSNATEIYSLFDWLNAA